MRYNRTNIIELLKKINCNRKKNIKTNRDLLSLQWRRKILKIIWEKK